MQGDVPGSVPRVSVVLPVFNGHDTIGAAIDSVLHQTLPDLELVVIDDGSSDGTSQILRERASLDPRMRIIEHRRNEGLVRSLNEGIDAASAPLVARLDADDIAAATRLARQVTRFDSPEVVLSATAYERVTSSGESIRTVAPPGTHAALAGAFLTGNCICHSSVMFRRDAVLALGGYRAEWFPAEDFDLWIRLLSVGRYAPVESCEIRYLVNDGGISATNSRQTQIAELRARQYAEDVIGTALVGPSPSARTLEKAALALQRDFAARGIESAGLFTGPLGVLLAERRALPRAIRHASVLASAPRLYWYGMTGRRGR